MTRACHFSIHSGSPLLIHIILSELTKGSEGTRTVLAIGPGTQLNDCQPNTGTDHNYSSCKSSERSDRQSETFITLPCLTISYLRGYIFYDTDTLDIDFSPKVMNIKRKDTMSGIRI